MPKRPTGQTGGLKLKKAKKEKKSKKEKKAKKEKKSKKEKKKDSDRSSDEDDAWVDSSQIEQPTTTTWLGVDQGILFLKAYFFKFL